ncbi:MAG: VWA domain-containing protein [Deltaproteobacteria bacterium]|nr:VWA domain-containing protein [Deltaproteobacteria bacterium]
MKESWYVDKKEENRLAPGLRPPTPFPELVLHFITELRAAGLRISIAESMDAMEAVGAVGVEQDLLREALAACLVKEEDDRFIFDEIFARFFAGPKGRRKGKLQTSSGEGERQNIKTQGNPGRPQDEPPEESRKAKSQVSKPSEQQPTNNEDQKTDNKPATPNPELRPLAPDSQPPAPELRTPAPSPQPLAPKRKALLEKPFHLFDARDVEETKDLVETLARQFRARLSRRYKPRKHGRLDFRRTIRTSMSHGGVPIELLLRGRKPGKPDLLVLCDLSGSVATVTDFLLALIAPAASYFRRVRSFAYVDRLCEVSFENGHVIPHTELDLYARSDFGKVLQQFWQYDGEQLLTRQTLVLILGDARNNRRPPRPDLLIRMRDAGKKLVWLNPEPVARWNTGDSVMKLYEPACDIVLACGNLRELMTALKLAI